MRSLPELLGLLSADARKYLDLELENPRGSFAAAATVATHCIRAGLSEDEYLRVVKASALGDRLSSSKRLKTEAQLLKNLESAWRYSEEHFDHGYFDPDKTIREQLVELLERIRTGVWTGKSANSDRAVAAALVGMALEAGGNAYSVHASTRQLSVASGVGSMTVSRTLPRLRTLGLIKGVRLRGKGASREWILDLHWKPEQILVGHSDTDELPIKDSSVPELPSTKTHEVFIGRDSLGQSAARIWDWLSANGSGTTAEIRQGTGLGDKTTRTHLDRMVGLGLLTRAGSRSIRYSISETADLDSVARQLGSAGWREKTKAKHALEREAVENPSTADPEMVEMLEKLGENRGSIPDFDPFADVPKDSEVASSEAPARRLGTVEVDESLSPTEQLRQVFASMAPPPKYPLSMSPLEQWENTA